MKKIISLHGSYFGNNYGDVLLVNIFAKWIHECCPDYIINLPLADKAKTKDLPDGVTGILNLLRSKYLVFCGGGYFGEQPRNKKAWARRNFFRHGIIGILARFFRIPYAIIGVEFGPISSRWFKRVCVGIAKHARVVVVRNAESKEFLEANGVKGVFLSADAVLCLSDSISPAFANSDDIVIHIPGITNAPLRFFGLIQSLITQVKEKCPYSRLLFINDSFADIYHTDAYRQIFDFLDTHDVSYDILPYKGYKSLIEVINTHRYVLTTKLHVGITAAALNKRPLSFWQHPKTKRLHEQIGNTSYCYPINGTESFNEIIKDYFSHKESFNLSSDIKALAYINKDKLFAFLLDD